MKRLLTFLVFSGMVASTFAQWKPAPKQGGRLEYPSQKEEFFTLDINQIRNQLANAQEAGNYAQPVVISVPVKGGKMERFNVYSAPVVVQELADQYQLGSYAGVGIDDPSKTIRFSVAPNDFQSMIMKSGGYEFIEPSDKSQNLYRLYLRDGQKGDKAFVCHTEEGSDAQNQMNQLYKAGQSFANNPSDFSKSSDKKYRTYRLALSVTGEYTTYFGGTAGALAQINATMTRVNGVFEKDFALKLILQNFPGLIYNNSNTDPYSPPATGANGAWSSELANVLMVTPGNAAFDIGHLFGHAGGGGYAGCIGCICSNATNAYKGSAYTSPGSGAPMGDTFDIDYVAHEMGHQLGANHTFSHGLEGSGSNMEPGSGSTIMGYAGITGPTTDVQPHSDPYFHARSIEQVQTNIINRNTCGVAVNITNNPPVITALTPYTIPKGTAFVLTANVTDPEGDPMTYTWEQYDTATQPINTSNLGNTTTGAAFRSVLPGTSPTRYFPRLSSVLSGVLNNSNNLWEAVPTVARTMNFRITARDNNANVAQQQTQYAQQTITVGNDGPFAVTSTQGFNNTAGPLTWDVAATNAAPYNSPNVKIDYTTNNGATWTTLIASTPNDGSEDVQFTGLASGSTAIVRISSINNVFYAVKTLTINTLTACDGTAPQNITVSNISGPSATVSWNAMAGATYEIQYRIVGSATWTTVTSNVPTVNLTGLTAGSNYEVQVRAICSGTPGAWSPSTNFSTTVINYCTAGANNTNFEYISNVTLANVNNNSMNSSYTNYTTNPALQINLVKGNTYTLSVTKAWMDNNPDFDAVSAWIDFNLNGTFEDSERVMSSPVSTATPVTATFTVPATAVENQALRMRVINVYGGSSQAGAILTSSCGTLGYGEVEDYNVVVTGSMATREVTDNAFQIYPNPATDVLHITKVSNKARYQIHSMAGQLVDGGLVKEGKVNVSGLVTGNYLITVTDENINATVKFIKK